MSSFLLDKRKIDKNNNERKRINIKERQCKNVEIEQSTYTTFQREAIQNESLCIVKPIEAPSCCRNQSNVDLKILLQKGRSEQASYSD